MKKLEVVVRPHRLGTADDTVAGPTAADQSERCGKIRDRKRGRGDLRLEVVVSDADAKQVVGTLLETGKVAQISNSVVSEFVANELRVPSLDGNDLYDRVLARVERELLRQVLRECEGITTKAAARLGINRNTVHKLRVKYDLCSTCNRTTLSH